MIAYYKLRADRTQDLRIIAWYHREIVLSDCLFTIPSGVTLFITGLSMVHVLELSLRTTWVLLALSSFSLAGLFWVPAAFLQIRMRNLAEEAYKNQTPLSPAYYRASRIWFFLGFPSFFAALFTLWIMVSKWYP